MNLGEFDGKTVLVTGAAQGIGSVVAKMFLERGATVIAVDQNEEGLNVLLNQNELNNTRMKTFRLDVSDSAAVEDMVNHIANEIAPIDILINVAGVLRMGPIHSLSDEDWNKTFSVNTTGVFNMSRAVSKNMMLRKSGAIVTVGSNAANTPRMEMAAYAASKAATTMFMKCLGLELAAYNIRCNLVSPGSTETEMQRLLWADENGAKNIIAGSQNTYRLGIPLQKLHNLQKLLKQCYF